MYGRVDIDLLGEPPHLPVFERARVERQRRGVGAAVAAVLGAGTTVAGVVVSDMALAVASWAVCAAALGLLMREHNQRCLLLPISGKQCQQMAQWWDQYAAIGNYCRRVVAQGREIMTVEYHAACTYAAEMVDAAGWTALYRRADALPMPVDHRFRETLRRSLVAIGGEHVAHAVRLIDHVRDRPLRGRLEAKAFVDAIWECVSKQRRAGSEAERPDLADLERSLAYRSIALGGALRRVPRDGFTAADAPAAERRGSTVVQLPKVRRLARQR